MTDNQEEQDNLNLYLDTISSTRHAKRCSRYLNDLLMYSNEHFVQLSIEVTEQWLEFHKSCGKKFGTLYTLAYTAVDYIHFLKPETKKIYSAAKVLHNLNLQLNTPLFLSEDELNRIRKAASEYPKYACLIELICELGLKTFDISKLRLDNLNIQNKKLIVNVKKGTHIINLSERSVAVLRHYLRFRKDDNPYLLSGIRGEKIDLHEIYFIVQWCSGRANIHLNVTPSILRNTGIIIKLKQGVTINRLTKDLGYKHATAKLIRLEQIAKE